MILRHFLDFKDSIGRIEISEPFGFDGSTHKVEQSENYGRDVVLGNEEIDLILTNSHFETIEPTQQLTDGTPFNYASQGFEYFINELKTKGWESEIEYILEKDGVEFSVGIVDGLTAIVSKDEVKFKTIQNTKREEVKRRLDVVIDAFSNEDLDGNPTEPCVPINLLMKAKPIVQISEYGPKTVPLFQDFGNAFLALTAIPIGGVLENFGIKDTFSPFFEKIHLPNYNNAGFATYLDDTKVLTAKTELTNLKIEIKKLSVIGFFNAILGTSCNIIARRFIVGSHLSIETQSVNIPLFFNTFSVENQDYEFNFPIVNQGESVQVIFQFNFSTSGLQNYVMQVTSFSCESLKMTTTSTSIDTVVKAVRYIDLVKHACKSVGIMDTICPNYDIEGEHYNNFATNGYLLGKVTDKPFNNQLKDLLNVAFERNNGYQINPNNIEILHYDDFYPDTEIGALIEIPNLRDNASFDNNLAVLKFDYNYKNSSKDRETNSEGSIDEVHGQTQWLMPSKKTDKTVKFEFDHVRSAFLIEEQRRRVFDNQNTTSLSEDTKLFLIKVIPTSPARRGGFTATLRMQFTTSPNRLKILSSGFNWNLLGFGVGSSFLITTGENLGNYIVESVESGVLTLIGGAANFNGVATITVSYLLNDVNFINETFEPFAQISGIQNSQNYSNLRYSIKRNLVDFYSLIGTYATYLSGEIKNTLFDINGNLSTRFIGETNSLTDNAVVDIDEIKEMRKIEPRIETVNVFADFETATEIFNKISTEKGYIRVQKQDNTVVLGYPKEGEYKWADASLELKLRPKKESEFYEIDITLINSFNINGNFVSLYDSNDILIITPREFFKMKINGVVYEDINEFAEALITAIA